MRVYLDTEFLEDGKTIELISIGLVSEYNRTLYAENSEFDWGRSCVTPWLRENVQPHLMGGSALATRAEIAQRVVEFAGPIPEFWSYFGSYDWVLLCQMYGRMIDLPSGWPMFCLDLKQEMISRGVVRSELPIQGTKHHALSDAFWVKGAHEHMFRLAR